MSEKLAQHTIEKARRPVARFPDRVKLDLNRVIEESPSGEDALLAAVVAQGIHDAHKPEHAPEARRWLLSDNEEPLSFRWYCRLLSLAPENILKIAFGERTLL